MNPYDLLKDAIKVLKETGKVEIQEKVIEAQKELLEMQKHIQDLEADNKELKEKLKTKGTLIIKNHAYWDKDTNDGPYCTRCWDAEFNRIHMHPMGNPAFYSCPNCESGSVKAKPELDDSQRQFRSINHNQYT